MIVSSCQTAATLYRVAVAALLFLFIAQPAKAQLSLLLLPATKNGTPGSTLQWSARLTNLNSSTPLYLNGIAFDIPIPSDSYMTEDDTPFFFEVPGSLSSMDNPSNVYEGHIFDVKLENPIPLEQLSGRVTILGGSTPSSLEDLASADFTVNVSQLIPEPSPLVLVLPVLLLLGIHLMAPRNS